MVLFRETSLETPSVSPLSIPVHHRGAFVRIRQELTSRTVVLSKATLEVGLNSTDFNPLSFPTPFVQDVRSRFASFFSTSLERRYSMLA